MEMKEIDLTKCVNLRYKAKIDGNEDYGRICVENADTGLAFLRSDREDGYIAAWHCDEPGVEGCSGRKVTDFEIVPRDPETYKDWQVGDVIGCLDEDGDMDIIADHLCRVIFRSGELVAIAENYSAEEADINGCYTCSQLFRECWRLVLTDIEQQIIEQQIIEEKNEYKPQDGDICFVKTSAGNRFIFIKRDNESDDEIHGYIIMATNSKSLYSSNVLCVCERKSIREFRPATEKERQKLFDAMAKKGKRWNAEKKVVEDIPKPYEFKKGEPVLVRDDQNERWKIRVFEQIREGKQDYPYLAIEGIEQCREGYKYCLPYNERTMHLLGTSRDYEEER